jgi:nitrite reductase/ring-hydroxylating ferredoxin subunit/uncharacterized membrane protein
MRSTAHIKGHPLHPMLIPFPFAFLVGGAIVDVWAGLSGRSRWHRSARDMTTLGLGSAIIAAMPGLVDYLTIVPPRSSAHTRATRHMVANLAAVGLFATARLGRRDSNRRPSAWRLASELAGAGLLAAGGWLGGTLVTRNQISVDHRYADAGKWRVERIPEERLQGRRIEVSVADLEPDQMKLVLVGDRRIVVARTDDGYVAFDDRCTHKGGPLSDGVLACGTVQCPWHGSQFEVHSGNVKRGPATTPIETYEVVDTPALTRRAHPAEFAGQHS